MNLLMTFISILIVIPQILYDLKKLVRTAPTQPSWACHIYGHPDTVMIWIISWWYLLIGQTLSFLSFSVSLTHSDFNKMSNCIGSTLACVIGINNSFSFSVSLSFKRSSCVLKNVESVRERRNWRDVFFLISSSPVVRMWQLYSCNYSRV